MAPNKHLNKNIFETFGLDPNETRTFFHDDSGSSSFAATEVVDLKESATSPTWDGRVGAFRRHHCVDVVYPSLNLLKDPAEEFLLNKPLNSERRYAPQPLIMDDQIMQMASRNRLHDNGFHSVYKCNQPVPDLSIRNLTGKDLFADVDEATRCHGFTHIGAIVFVDRSQPGSGPQIRIRRATRFQWNEVFDYNERDYTMSLRDFIESRVQPTWWLDLIHLLGIESDRAARFIAIKLKNYTQTEDAPREDLADVYRRFMKSFRAESRQDQDLILAVQQLVKPFKSTVLKRTPKCIGCGEKCLAGASLPCSTQHVMHDRCLLDMCRRSDVATATCPTCSVPVFVDNEPLVAELKFHVGGGVFRNDPRFSTWENFELSCSDLDSTQAATNDYPITITRGFMRGLFHKIVESSIEPGIPSHLRFDMPDEYALLEANIDGQFMHLEGVKTTIWALDRWIKRRVFFRFRNEFFKWQLDSALTDSEKKLTHRDDFMRKILRRGWYDAYLKNLNRTLQFLSERKCLCGEGKNSVYHWHGGREYWNWRVVEKQRRELTPARREIYEWQKGEAGQGMMEKFRVEVEKGERERAEDEEAVKEGRRPVKRRVPLWTSDE
ncbi:hypothetical protein Slin14017_G022850 [Septoria linicola]|nr:hypothetical protein Slin14017_G022850 [Septoria linicola]